jgi:hypothetical protein
MGACVDIVAAIVELGYRGKIIQMLLLVCPFRVAENVNRGVQATFI